MTAANLIDAVVYGTTQAADAELIAALTPGKPQVQEGTDAQTLALARRPDATTALDPAQFEVQSPTPGMSNVTGTSYGLWALGFPGLGALNDDVDMDGLPNRMEFALGTNPLLPNASGIPAPSVVGGNLRYTFNKSVMAGNDPATHFVPEVSTDLVNWSGTDVTIVAHNTAVLIFDYTGTSPRILMRVRVVLP